MFELWNNESTFYFTLYLIAKFFSWKGIHNWHIEPFLESASFKKRYVLSNSQLQLLSQSKPQLQLLENL